MSFVCRCPLLYGKRLPVQRCPDILYWQYSADDNQRIDPYTRGKAAEYPAPVSEKPEIGNMNKLDDIKHTKGISSLKGAFFKMLEEDYENAVEEINSENLTFGCLFELKAEAGLPTILERLKTRNIIALALMAEAEVLENNISLPVYKYSSCGYIEAFHSALKWILVTGSGDDGLNDEFDKVLDTAASLLIKEYSDTTVLPVLADLIFKRNREGSFYHDLVWLLFESRKPDSLIFIGNRLQSPHPEDKELAEMLLSFIPGVGTRRGRYNEDPYSAFRSWLEENIRFLYYTGECSQQSANPAPYRIMPEAKYLCKAVSADTGSIVDSLSAEDYKLLAAFQEQSKKDMQLLADFSYALHKENTERWNTWLRIPISEQIHIAKLRGGKVHD
ncbi:MAG TPA: hypothetical protein VN580_12455 [Clostridia bacterium]|nr:hypothetical protein [Clostridia bacterium]